MKKFAKYLLVLCIMIPCAFIFTSCKKTAQASSVMTLSVNPEVSFVLDSNNKVMSVNYSNEDAGNLYADINFVGKDVDSSIQIFVERAVISGHIDLDGDEVTVEINGANKDNVKQLTDNVKTKVKSVFKSFGVDVEVSAKEFTEKAQHEALVARAEILAPEKDSEELYAMSDEDLIKLINEKQTELKDLTYEQVQKLQDQYSAVKNSVLNIVDNLRAELKSLRENLEEIENKYKDSIPDYIQTQIDQLKAKLDEVQKELDAKINSYLEQKSQEIEAMKQQYNDFKQKADLEFKSQVETSKQNVINHLETSKKNGTITEEQYNYWVNIINSQAA